MTPPQGFPRIPGFEISDRIGFGGFATVYRARQPGLERTVAIKVVHRTRGADEEILRRFRRECQAIGSLTGAPAVMTVFDLGTTPDGDPYLVLEYLDGGSLQEELRSSGRFAWQEVVRVARDLSGALNAAHGLGILHRDIKPANVLRDHYGNVRLGDFGIAHLAGAADSTTGDTAMTISYAAPEMLAGERATTASDFYSLGALMHTLLDGRPPFSRSDDNSAASVIARIVTEPPPTLDPGVAPRRLAELIDGLMAKEPRMRPGGAQVVSVLGDLDDDADRLRRDRAEPTPRPRVVQDDEDRTRRPRRLPPDASGPHPGVPVDRSTSNPFGSTRRRSPTFSSHTVNRRRRPSTGASVTGIAAWAGGDSPSGTNVGPVDSALGLSGPLGRAIFDSGLRGRHSVGGLGYAVDIVFVLDTTASMWPVLAQVKQHAMGFHEHLVATMSTKGKYVSKLRVRTIAYRDFLDFPDDALSVTPFWELPEQLDRFRGHVASLRADGGGDEPESGLEALAVAMMSPWERASDRCRQVIVVCTDASAHPLEAAAGSVIRGYPAGLPSSFDALTDAWGDTSGTIVNYAAKRLLLYAPDVYPWNVISAYWDSVLHFPSRAGEGLTELDFSSVVHAIAGSV